MHKINKVPLTVCFDDYNGPANDYDAGCEFFREKFESKNRTPDKEIYTHVTCATDANNVTRVFNDVNHIVIEHSLDAGGLI